MGLFANETRIMGIYKYFKSWVVDGSLLVWILDPAGHVPVWTLLLTVDNRDFDIPHMEMCPPRTSNLPSTFALLDGH